MAATRTYKTSTDIAAEYIMHTFREEPLPFRIKAIQALNNGLNAKIFCMAKKQEKEQLFQE